MLLAEELSLVAQAQTGDDEALARLWDDITPKLYGYLLKVTSNTQTAEDVLQDTWLKAFKSIHTFKPRGVRFSAWLFAIARNECRQRWRKNGREVSLDEHTEFGDAMHTSDLFVEHLTLENVLASLREDERDILYLRYISELSFKEIAHVLEISIVSARVRVHRALKRAHSLIME